MKKLIKAISLCLYFLALTAGAQSDDDDFLITLLTIAAQQQSSEPPNILFIIADDLGIDASNQYSVGNLKPLTPTLDDLALAERELERLPAPAARVEDRPVLERAHVVHGHLVARSWEPA